MPARTKKASKKVARRKTKTARKSVKRVSASMRSKKAHQNWIDAVITLGLLALAIEMAGFIWIGPGFTASVYNPLKQTESRLSETNDQTGIRSSAKFTACERRALKIRNQKRREQLLTICAERKLRGAATSSSSSSVSSRSGSLPQASGQFLDQQNTMIDSIKDLGGTSTIQEDAIGPGH